MKEIIKRALVSFMFIYYELASAYNLISAFQSSLVNFFYMKKQYSHSDNYDNDTNIEY